MGVQRMSKRTWTALAAVLVVLAAGSFAAYRNWSGRAASAREQMLAMIPADANAVFFADFATLRSTPFVAQLYAWAPKPQADPDYAQFIKDTGFDYERDLDRIAIATEKRGPDSAVFAIADGKFDRQKISAYALKAGTLSRTNGHEIYSVPVSGSATRISFAFLRGDRIALASGADSSALFQSGKETRDAAEWRMRFERLAGSPVFAVIRQDAAAGAALAAQAPGGFRSPQLSTLLDQLQWITIAGKPESDRLSVIAEGECAAESTTRQLTDLLNGVMILAEAGLNDSKTRQQLDPAAREAYLEFLKGAEVSKIDRGDTRSVRLVLEITPKFLDAARAAPLTPSPAGPLPGKATETRKGHT